MPQMIQCPACDALVSSAAAACPHCGHPLKRAAKPLGCLSAFALAALAGIVAVIFTGNQQPNASGAPSVSPVPPEAAQTAQPPTPVEAGKSVPPVAERSPTWVYAAANSSMETGGVDHEAGIYSSNEIDLEAPYDGPQRAIMMVRKAAGHPYRVALFLDRGQFVCTSYELCMIVVKFDDRAPQNYPALAPPDGSSTQVDFQNPDEFIGELSHASVVKIQPIIYQNGNPVITFNVAGFSLDKMLATAPSDAVRSASLPTPAASANTGGQAQSATQVGSSPPASPAAGATSSQQVLQMKDEGPSFDCAKVTNPTAVAICGNAELSQLDREMATLYYASDYATHASTRAQQREWIQERNRACVDNVACLRSEFNERIRQLKQAEQPASN